VGGGGLVVENEAAAALQSIVSSDIKKRDRTDTEKERGGERTLNDSRAKSAKPAMSPSTSPRAVTLNDRGRGRTVPRTTMTQKKALWG